MLTYMYKLKETEAQVQDAICEYLERKGYSFWRQNTVGVWDARGFYRKPPQYVVKGVSDIICLCEGRAYFIEVKGTDGRQSEDQKLFQQFVERAGCEYILAKCLEDVIEAGF